MKYVIIDYLLVMTLNEPTCASVGFIVKLAGMMVTDDGLNNDEIAK